MSYAEPITTLESLLSEGETSDERGDPHYFVPTGESEVPIYIGDRMSFGRLVIQRVSRDTYEIKGLA